MSKSTNAGIGTSAPDFELTDGDGKRWTLSDHAGEVVVLLFYPGDETPICTRQMCSVRDNWEAYEATGAEVVGISTNTAQSHKDFSANHNLPLRLLADTERKVADEYGANSIIPGKVARSVFVIDANGTIRHRDVRPLGLFRPKDDEIITAIRAAQASTKAVT